MLPNNTILDLNKNIGGLTDLAKKARISRFAYARKIGQFLPV